MAVGVNVDGERDIVGLWAGDGGEGAKYWHHVLTEIGNRGTTDVCIVVYDALTGLPGAVGAVWPKAIVGTCVVHYADVVVMPMRDRGALPLQGSVSARSA